jgi:hypothetical protein
MRRACLALVALIAAADFAAAAECTCRSQGRDYELGKSVCLPTPKGARIATCGMVLNNTSWQFSDTPCVISDAASEAPPAQERASRAMRQGG